MRTSLYFDANIWIKLQRCQIIGRELPDALSLEECGVENGSTLKLILAMRGGPINTRRVVIPNTNNSRNASGGEAVGSANNIEDIMLKNKEKILDKIPKNGQVCYTLSWLFRWS